MTLSPWHFITQFKKNHLLTFNPVPNDSFLENLKFQDLSDFPPEGNAYGVCQRSRAADLAPAQHFTWRWIGWSGRPVSQYQISTKTRTLSYCTYITGTLWMPFIRTWVSQKKTLDAVARTNWQTILQASCDPRSSIKHLGLWDVTTCMHFSTLGHRMMHFWCVWSWLRDMDGSPSWDKVCLICSKPELNGRVEKCASGCTGVDDSADNDRVASWWHWR